MPEPGTSHPRQQCHADCVPLYCPLAAQELLGINVQALAASLSCLPMSEVLGVPASHLIELEEVRAGAAQPRSEAAVRAAPNASAAPQAAHTAPPALRPQQPAAPTTPYTIAAVATTAPPAVRAFAAPRAPAVGAPAPAVQPAEHARSADDDGLDELLGLLTGKVDGAQHTAAATSSAVSASSGTSTSGGPTVAAARTGSASSSAAQPADKVAVQMPVTSSASSLPRAVGVPSPGAPPAPPLRPKASALDDELDELLGLGGNRGAARKPAQPSARPVASKQSLEAWLDEV